jgi:hypothetical protein
MPSSLVPEFVLLIEGFGVAIRTLTFQPFGREPWLLRKKIISQRLAYLGMDENLAALFAY